jgi:hypothetical protein
MFRPHVIQFTGEFDLAECRLYRALSEPVHPQDEILLSGLELLASSFDPCACGEKTTTGLNAVSAPISPFMAAITPGPVAPEPRRKAQRQIGNHLKLSRPEFRIVNHSFTPA